MSKDTRRGARLVELRRSNAAGKHDPRPRSARTRGLARRTAIRDSREGWAR